MRVLWFVTLVACGNSTTPLPSNTLSVQIGPFDLKSGEEIVMCSVVKLPSTDAVDVTRIHTTLAPGSHHLVVYRTDATAEKAPYQCSSFAGVFHNQAPLFIAESSSSDMQLPTGVAYHFAANQMVLLEAHYINTSQAPISAKGIVELVPGAPGQSYQEADIMMCGSAGALACELGGGLQPGDPHYSLPVGLYTGTAVNLRGPAQDVDLTKLKFFAFTSHEHHRGIDAKIWKASSHEVSSAKLIYENSSWDNPPLTVLPDDQLLSFGPGEGFAWQCTYDTSADTQNVCFGESANDEMCFIWAYYYPSVGRFIAQDDCWAN